MGPRGAGRIIVKLQPDLARLLGVGGIEIQRSVRRRQRDRPGSWLQGKTTDLPPGGTSRAVPSRVAPQAAEPRPVRGGRGRVMTSSRRKRRDCATKFVPLEAPSRSASCSHHVTDQAEPETSFLGEDPPWVVRPADGGGMEATLEQHLEDT